jgi:hypothetical protein
MAGLLDIFGTSGADTMGLLGMSPTDIARNRDDAQAQALYALAGRLFQGGNTGQSIAEGLQAGQKAYRGGMQETLQGQLQNVQLQDMIRKRQQEQAALMRQQAVEQQIAKGYIPAQAGRAAQMVEEEGRYIGETPAVEAQPARFDLQSLAPALSATPEGRKALSELLASQKAMGGETTSLAEGAKLVRTNPITGAVEVVAEGAPKREPVQSDIAKYEFAKKNDGYKGSFTQFLLDEARAKATSINLPSEGERKAATLASRLNFSVGQMNQAIGADPKAAMPNTAAEIARFVSRSDFLPNKINTEQRQIVEAAQEDVLDAALTLGTGAAYSREQLAGYKKSYFPQIGDSNATVKAKQERLTNLLKSAEVASGRAASQITAPIPKAPTTPEISGFPSQNAIQAEIERRKKAGG